MKKAKTVIGEGITEKFYIESLKGLSPFNVLPQELGTKASSLKELEIAIRNAINQGYDEVYCLIDMDGKTEGNAKSKYLNLKNKYQKIHEIKKRGVKCKVVFIETERCTELWFLYHFTKSAITRKFNSYKELEKELKRYRPNYEKTERYFRSIGSIHKELILKSPSGSLKQAITNATQSVLSKTRDNRNYTYSEIHKLIEALEIT